MDNEKILTASGIRCLLTMKALSRADGGARCIDIAAALKLSKPSVHNRMDSFVKSGLVRKSAYGMAYFTDAGREVAERYARYYDAAYAMLAQNFPCADDLRDAVCLLLSEIPDEDLEALCQKNRHASTRAAGA